MTVTMPADAAQTPTTREWRTVGDNIWMVKGFFNLGEGQTSGLTYDGLKERLLTGLKVDTEGYESPVFAHENNDSSTQQVEEEKEKVAAIKSGDDVPFPLDSTMTVIRYNETDLMLRSLLPYSAELADEVQKLGNVTCLVAACLQHWLFLPGWKEAFPNAKVYITQAACGEDLTEKMPHIKDMIPLENGTQITPDVDQMLFRGAPLAMNEYIFYHKPSKTLICDDSFYGGYIEKECPTWFCRCWFKLTKGSFRGAKLPIYRTCRVREDVEAMLNAWPFDQIVYAHGTGLYTQNARDVFESAWLSVGAEA